MFIFFKRALAALAALCLIAVSVPAHAAPVTYTLDNFSALQGVTDSSGGGESTNFLSNPAGLAAFLDGRELGLEKLTAGIGNVPVASGVAGGFGVGAYGVTPSLGSFKSRVSWYSNDNFFLSGFSATVLSSATGASYSLSIDNMPAFYTAPLALGLNNLSLIFSTVFVPDNSRFNVSFMSGTNAGHGFTLTNAKGMAEVSEPGTLVLAGLALVGMCMIGGVRLRHSPQG